MMVGMSITKVDRQCVYFTGKPTWFANMEVVTDLLVVQVEGDLFKKSFITQEKETILGHLATGYGVWHKVVSEDEEEVGRLQRLQQEAARVQSFQAHGDYGNNRGYRGSRGRFQPRGGFRGRGGFTSNSRGGFNKYNKKPFTRGRTRGNRTHSGSQFIA